MPGLVSRGLTLEEIWNVDVNYVKVNVDINCQSLQPKYRSCSPGQGICQVSTLRRSTLQGLMVVGLIIEEISNIDAKSVKVTGAQNIGQGHWVKVPAESVHLGEALCKAW